MKNRIRWMGMAAMVIASACVFSACQKNVEVEKDTTTSAMEMVEESSYAVTTEQIALKVKEAYDDAFLPGIQLDEQQILQRFSLESGMYEEAYVLVSDSENDLCAIFQCGSSQIDQMEVALNQHRNELVNAATGDGVDNLKVQGSKVVRYDGFVALFILGDNEKVKDLDSARKQNEIADNTMRRVLGK